MSRLDAHITGDIGDNGSRPNSPNFVDPAYGLDDADMDVAADLVKADEVAELVCEVRESLGLLRWLADQSIPATHLPAYRQLLRKAEALDKAVDAKLDNWRGAA